MRFWRTSLKSPICTAIWPPSSGKTQIIGFVRAAVFGLGLGLDAGAFEAGVSAGAAGAAFGTALVATLLFGVLAIRNPDAAAVFAAMVEHAKNAGATLSADQRAAIAGDIASAFRAAFLLMALFTAGGFFLALTNPLRRI